MTYAFLSHSSADKDLVDELALKLGKEHIFYDKWNIDTGKLLPAEIAKGVAESKWFILIASKNAMASRWVKYEINLALLNWIKEENYRILVAKIDNCEIHPELTPFVFINLPGKPLEAVNKITEIVLSEGKGIIPIEDDWKKAIVDRHSELDVIETVALQGTKVIFFWGIYGIGKSTLSKHAAAQIFGKRIAQFPLTSGHDILRLALEMAGRAKIPLPKPGSSNEDLFIATTSAAKELIRQGYIIFFDDIELAIDDDEKIKDFLIEVLKKLIDLNDAPPIFLASTHYPKLDQDLADRSHIVRINPLKDNYILSLLQKWTKLSNPAVETCSKESLAEIAKKFHGYPLAARLASYIIVKYSLDEVARDLGYFKELRIDMAKQLIGRSQLKLSPSQLKTLEILTFADIGLSQEDLSNILKLDIAETRSILDTLFSCMLVQVERGRLQILPLIKEYFLNQAYSTRSWKATALNIARYCRNYLPACECNSEDFVHYSSIAYRLFVLADELEEAHKLAYYFEGELRNACISLYHAKEYKLSLERANLWLSINPKDNQIKWFKARSLTRMGLFAEAEKVLKELERLNYAPHRVAHAWGLYYKQRKDLENAIIHFKRGLDDWPDYIPLLRDYADTLEQMGELDRAIELLNQAYKIAPRDRYISLKIAAVLEKKGLLKDALDIMSGLLIAYPDDPYCLHRMSMLLTASGDLTGAYDYAKKAVAIDPKAYEAVTHLAAMEIYRDNIEEAKMLIEDLPGDLPYNNEVIRDTIKAELLLKEDKLDEARSTLKKRYIEDPYCANVLARIELKDAYISLSQGLFDLTKERIAKGLSILDDALKIYPNNYLLLGTHHQFEKVNKTMI